MRKQKKSNTLVEHIYRDVQKIINEELGTPAFASMPSRDTEHMRPVKLSHDEFQKFLLSDEVQKVCKEHDAYVSTGSGDKFPIFCVRVFDDKPSNDEITQMEKDCQKLMNDLDTKTALYIESSWMGNVGDFANKIAYCYTFKRYVSKILEKAPFYNFQEFYNAGSLLRRIQKENPGKVVCIFGRVFNDYQYLIKKTEKSSELEYDAMKMEIKDFADHYARQTYGSRFQVTLETGKRQIDSSSYEAFVVRHDGGYIGMFRIHQNKFGDCTMSYSAPLCGESCFDMTLENYEDAVKKVIRFFCHRED